ncbi:hypothetical protein B1B04_00865 [Lysinibacillus sp. KCTC 33748]|nr:hypothetical protein B1B04_00865 [Lysinibacillus sp. KCTC 33748]
MGTVDFLRNDIIAQKYRVLQPTLLEYFTCIIEIETQQKSNHKPFTFILRIYDLCLFSWYYFE